MRSPDDGFSVLQAARAKDEATRIVMLTGHGSREAAVRAMQQGATYYIEKPIDLAELRTKVSKVPGRACPGPRVPAASRTGPSDNQGERHRADHRPGPRDGAGSADGAYRSRRPAQRCSFSAKVVLARS